MPRVSSKPAETIDPSLLSFPLEDDQKDAQQEEQRQKPASPDFPPQHSGESCSPFGSPLVMDRAQSQPAEAFSTVSSPLVRRPSTALGRVSSGVPRKDSRSRLVRQPVKPPTIPATSAAAPLDMAPSPFASMESLGFDDIPLNVASPVQHGSLAAVDPRYHSEPQEGISQANPFSLPRAPSQRRMGARGGGDVAMVQHLQSYPPNHPSSTSSSFPHIGHSSHPSIEYRFNLYHDQTTLALGIQTYLSSLSEGIAAMQRFATLAFGNGDRGGNFPRRLDTERYDSFLIFSLLEWQQLIIAVSVCKPGSGTAV